MNMAKRRAINKLKKHLKEKLKNVDVQAETSAEEVKEAISKPKQANAQAIVA